MIKNYFKIAWRSLLKGRWYSVINIGGLSLGMVVAVHIGLWVWDELSFNKYFSNYNQVVQVMQHETSNGITETGPHIPMPLRNALQDSYGSYFTRLSLSSWINEHFLTYGDNTITSNGSYVQSDFPEILPLKMLKGTRTGLLDPSSIMISESTAHALFGTDQSLGQTVLIDGGLAVKVTGIYEDLPTNTSFEKLQFISSWDLYLSSWKWLSEQQNNWSYNAFQLFAQINPNSDPGQVSEKIKEIKAQNADEEEAAYDPEIFLSPMRDWHLKSEWVNGKQLGRKTKMIWLVGGIGLAVLVLACINFINLSTARSDRRIKEAGVRMSIGSMRKQLIGQFLGESLLVVTLSFMLALALLVLSLPLSNTLTIKNMLIPWSEPLFWLFSLSFIVITALVSGLYPALYFSSYSPVSILKGTFRAGRFATTPRKVMVVFQYAVSIMLITGTFIVYKQIRFSKDRPVGYERENLITIQMKSADFYKKFDLLRTELINSRAVAGVSASSSPTTRIAGIADGFNWEGKDPGLQTEFAYIFMTPEYGKTVGWEIKEGRDMSREFSSDSTAVILNESAAKFMGIQDPIGKQMIWGAQRLHIIGIVKDMIMESPYKPVKPAVYLQGFDHVNWINLKLNPQMSAGKSIEIIESVIEKIIPAIPFNYKFMDQEYAVKFSEEERTASFASVFALIAVFISCLGLFGLAAYTAEHRTKEIGIRKVNGAKLIEIMTSLNKDFVKWVAIAFAIAAPVAYYAMHKWLENFAYKTELSWWIFALAGLLALGIALLTVSWQSWKAATRNPVESLRYE